MLFEPCTGVGINRIDRISSSVISMDRVQSVVDYQERISALITKLKIEASIVCEERMGVTISKVCDAKAFLYVHPTLIWVSTEYYEALEVKSNTNWNIK